MKKGMLGLVVAEAWRSSVTEHGVQGVKASAESPESSFGVLSCVYFLLALNLTLYNETQIEGHKVRNPA